MPPEGVSEGISSHVANVNVGCVCYRTLAANQKGGHKGQPQSPLPAPRAIHFQIVSDQARIPATKHFVSVCTAAKGELPVGRLDVAAGEADVGGELDVH